MLKPKLNIDVRNWSQHMRPCKAQSKNINALALWAKNIKIGGLCRPYLTVYPPMDIYSNNIVAISPIPSCCPLSLWKDDNLCIFLNEERRVRPLTTDSCFMHEQISIFKALS